jgi:hypothetical protein
LKIAPNISEDSPFNVYADRVAIGRTEKGLILLVFGLILGVIPFVGQYLAATVDLIGIILILVGRKPFGPSHSNFIKLSIVVWCIGILIAIIVGASFGAAISNLELSGASQTSPQQAVTSALDWLAVGSLVTAAVLGIPNVLLTFGLQALRARVLLVAGYVTSLAVGVLVMAVILPKVDEAVAQAFSTQDLTPIESIQSQAQLLGFLTIIPAAIYAFAYYEAYSRIEKGQVPLDWS